eukprot:5188107-Pyramimonas_sp.AAC.1
MAKRGQRQRELLDAIQAPPRLTPSAKRHAEHAALRQLVGSEMRQERRDIGLCAEGVARHVAQSPLAQIHRAPNDCDTVHEAIALVVEVLKRR